MVALAIEECNLHRRVALKALKLVGTSPRMLLVGFMLPTAVLSMWISNTASSAMMIPILEAVLSEVLNDQGDAETGSASHKSPKPQISAKNMRALLAMSICMSANIGGTATTIGVYTQHPYGLVHDLLCDAILEICVTFKKLLPTVLITRVCKVVTNFLN